MAAVHRQGMGAWITGTIMGDHIGTTIGIPLCCYKFYFGGAQASRLLLQAAYAWGL